MNTLSPRSKGWTAEEDNFLRENYPQQGKRWCMERLGKSEAQIRGRASVLGLRQDKTSTFFTDWQKRAAQSKIGKKRPDHAQTIKRLWAEGKFPEFTDERRRQTGKRISRLWAERGHPKGMLGAHHSNETKQKISLCSQRTWADPTSKLNSKENKQRQSDQMAQRVLSDPRLNHGFSKGKKGIRADLGIYVRSSWEANYARYLNFLIKTKKIYKWEYESDTFWFEQIKRGTRHYTPDFKVWDSESSTPYYIEVKGWMTAQGQTKLDRMKRYYPHIEIRLVRAKEYKEIKKWKKIIPGWE